MNAIKSFFVALGALTFATFTGSPADALLTPVPIATDARIKTVLYSPNEVIKFTAYYRYQSNIQFEEGEQIATISLGDSIPWQMNPVGNRIFLKPIEPDATTNMTVITNRRTYFFELHAGGDPGNIKDISDKDLTFELRIVYPSDDNSSIGAPMDHVPDLEQEDLNKFNFRYTISGSEEISPIRIFDDGEFTYFQFHDINADIPAFFQVDKDGNESVINYRTRGAYIVVERVAARYTLRRGKSVVCIFNEARIEGQKRPQAKKSSSWFGNWFSGSDNSSSHQTGNTPVMNK